LEKVSFDRGIEMSLFLKVETRSRILGSKDNDVVYIAVSDIRKIEESSGAEGSVVTYGNNGETAVSEHSVKTLLTTKVVDLSLSAGRNY